MTFLPRVSVYFAAFFTAYACGVGAGPSRIEAAELARSPAGPVLRVAIVGAPGDARVPEVRAALAFWNHELARLGRRLRFDSGTVVTGVPLPEGALSAASRAQPRPWAFYFDARLRSSLRAVPGEAVVALSTSPSLISFGVPFEDHRQRGLVGLRPIDRWPLTLPNVARTVAAHELGHVLGLRHNADARTLMCGRPASCRPADFVSDTTRFFPLTAEDEAWIRQRWP